MILIDPEGRCAPSLPRGALKRDAARMAGASPGGDKQGSGDLDAVSYTHLTLPTNREV